MSGCKVYTVKFLANHFQTRNLIDDPFQDARRNTGMFRSTPMGSSIQPNTKGMIAIEHNGVSLMKIILDLHAKTLYGSALYVKLKF
jgi:hypothetical protein